jgi:hypothetical protein
MLDCVKVRAELRHVEGVQEKCVEGVQEKCAEGVQRKCPEACKNKCDGGFQRNVAWTTHASRRSFRRSEQAGKPRVEFRNSRH